MHTCNRVWIFRSVKKSTAKSYLIIWSRLVYILSDHLSSLVYIPHRWRYSQSRHLLASQEDRLKENHNRMGTQDSICSRSHFSATTLLHVRFYEHVNSSAARDSFYGLQSGHTLILTVCVRSHFCSSTIAQSVAMSPLVFPAFLFSFGDTYCLQFFL